MSLAQCNRTRPNVVFPIMDKCGKCSSLPSSYAPIPRTPEDMQALTEMHSSYPPSLHMMGVC